MNKITTDSGLFNLGDRQFDIYYRDFHYAFYDDIVDPQHCEVEGLQVRMLSQTKYGTLSLDVTDHLTLEEIEDIKWTIIAHERKYV